MHIDETHRPWFVACVAILGVSTALYIPYHLYWPNGPSGGSLPGLAYGIIGSAFMVFAGLLAARKKRPVWRVGRAQTWLRGHLWLGLISLPLIFFHAGFAFGGALTTTLMLLFIIVIVSGVLGAALQHFLPRMMTVEVPFETIFEQIDTIRSKLREEADQVVDTLCEPVTGSVRTGAPPAPSAPSLSTTAVNIPVGAAVLEVEEEAAHRLRDFYLTEVVPFLEAPAVGGSALAEAKRAEAVFRQLRTMLPPNFQEAVEDLENICEEERQLNRQARLHHLLHGWLLVHIPLSLALLLLGVIHAVMALAY